MNKILIFSFLLSSCTQMSDFQVQKDIDGVNRIYFKKMNDKRFHYARAIRDDKGRLINSEKKAKKEFAKISEPGDIIEDANLVDECSEYRSYQASKLYHQALKIIKTSPQKAESLLEAAVNECKSLKSTSRYYYLLAYTSQAQNKKKEMKSNLTKFLTYSERSYPFKFYQYDAEETALERLENTELRNQAMATLNNQSKLSLKGKSFEGARMRYNSTYGPGGENIFVPNYILLLNSNPFESFYGLIYDRPTKYFSILPSIVYGTESGSYLNLKIRKRLYESYDRRMQVGVSLGAEQWKSITYTGKGFSNYIYDVNATVEEDGYNYFVGAGSTFRPFSPDIGISAELKYYRLTQNDSNRLINTALLFYEFMSDMGIRGGYLNNSLTAEFFVSSIFIGYNFDDEYLTSGFGRTF